MAACSVGCMFSLYFENLWFWMFPVLVLGAGFGFRLLWLLIFAYFLLSSVWVAE